MEVLGYVALALIIAGFGVGVAMMIRSVPDIRGYLAMRRM